MTKGKKGDRIDKLSLRGGGAVERFEKKFSKKRKKFLTNRKDRDIIEWLSLVRDSEA